MYSGDGERSCATAGTATSRHPKNEQTQESREKQSDLSSTSHEEARSHTPIPKGLYWRAGTGLVQSPLGFYPTSTRGCQRRAGRHLNQVLDFVCESRGSRGQERARYWSRLP